jgi:GNAT superfamily N-acetyltransferase
MHLRPAQPEDALAVARVHVRSWQVAYRGLLPDDYLNRLRPEDRASSYAFADPDPAKPHTIVAAENGIITGFAATMPSRDPALPSHGELAAIYIDPDHWNRGIGAALITAARTHLIELGYGDAYLWVLSGNLRAERFYQHDGWLPSGEQRADTVWNIAVKEVRYLRSLKAASI